MSFKLLARDESGAALQVDQFLIGAWNKLSDSVPASSSKNIDTVNLSDFNGLDYILTLYNDAESVGRKIQVSVLREGATVIDEVFGRTGSLSNISVNVNVVGSAVNLEIINNNIYEINISFAKLLL